MFLDNMGHHNTIAHFKWLKQKEVVFPVWSLKILRPEHQHGELFPDLQMSAFLLCVQISNPQWVLKDRKGVNAQVSLHKAGLILLEKYPTLSTS
jgi:hypothetical protein